jgi:hypothetical protein
MGQHPRTWFSSTTTGFPRADAAWLLRQISSLETPVTKPFPEHGCLASALAVVGGGGVDQQAGGYYAGERVPCPVEDCLALPAQQ